MPTPPMSAEVMVEALELHRLHGSVRAAAEASGINVHTLDRRWRQAKRAVREGRIAGPPIPAIARPPVGFVVSRNNGEYDADGKLQRQWVGTKRDAGEEYTVPAGHVVKGESALLDPDGRVLAKWVKTTAGAGDGLVEGLRAAFAEYDGAAPIIAVPDVSDNTLLTVYPVPDLHLGMMSWGKETGADYDVAIATAVASESMATLVGQSLPSSDAVVLILGDFYHQNDSTNSTPASKHLLDVDGRWPKVYLAGARLAIGIVERAASKHAGVEVVVLPGNHDPDAAVTLAVALSLFFSQTTRITVNLTPGVLWYRRFGACLLGANHGHTMRTAERMAMAMAVDCAEDWGKTQHPHIFAGHLHHEIMKEVAGVRVETLTSPAARDGWNSASGYRSSRALSAITFHNDEGEIGRHRVNIVAPPRVAA